MTHVPFVVYETAAYHGSDRVVVDGGTLPEPSDPNDAAAVTAFEEELAGQATEAGTAAIVVDTIQPLLDAVDAGGSWAPRFVVDITDPDLGLVREDDTASAPEQGDGAVEGFGDGVAGDANPEVHARALGEMVESGHYVTADSPWSQADQLLVRGYRNQLRDILLADWADPADVTWPAFPTISGDPDDLALLDDVVREPDITVTEPGGDTKIFQITDTLVVIHDTLELTYFNTARMRGTYTYPMTLTGVPFVTGTFDNVDAAANVTASYLTLGPVYTVGSPGATSAIVEIARSNGANFASGDTLTIQIRVEGEYAPPV